MHLKLLSSGPVLRGCEVLLPGGYSCPDSESENNAIVTSSVSGLTAYM